MIRIITNHRLDQNPIPCDTHGTLKRQEFVLILDSPASANVRGINYLEFLGIPWEDRITI
jgi:hypothetical protein